MKNTFLSFLILYCSFCAFGNKDSCLVKFKKIAEEYNPTSKVNGDSSKIPDVPIFTKPQRQIILSAYKTNKEEAEKYVMLILLKVYKAQLSCCKMGYNLSDNGFSKDYNIIVYLFIKITNFCNMKSKMECSYISSAVTYTWVNSHSQFSSYVPIKRELEEIEILDKSR